MKVDDFLAEVLRDGEKATVNANELQKLIRKVRSLEKKLLSVTMQNNKLKSDIWILNSKIKSKEALEPLYIDLAA